MQKDFIRLCWVELQTCNLCGTCLCRYFIKSVFYMLFSSLFPRCLSPLSFPSSFSIFLSLALSFVHVSSLFLCLSVSPYLSLSPMLDFYLPSWNVWPWLQQYLQMPEWRDLWLSYWGMYMWSRLAGWALRVWMLTRSLWLRMQREVCLYQWSILSTCYRRMLMHCWLDGRLLQCPMSRRQVD